MSSCICSINFLGESGARFTLPAYFDGTAFAQIIDGGEDVMIQRSFSWMVAMYWECHDDSALIEFDDGNMHTYLDLPE